MDQIGLITWILFLHSIWSPTLCYFPNWHVFLFCFFITSTNVCFGLSSRQNFLVAFKKRSHRNGRLLAGKKRFHQNTTQKETALFAIKDDVRARNVWLSMVPNILLISFFHGDLVDWNLKYFETNDDLAWFASFALTTAFGNGVTNQYSALLLTSLLCIKGKLIIVLVITARKHGYRVQLSKWSVRALPFD